MYKIKVNRRETNVPSVVIVVKSVQQMYKEYFWMKEMGG